MLNKSRLVDFLRQLDEDKLADKLLEVSPLTSNRKVMSLTEDISSALYMRVVRIRKPKDVTVMTFDREQRSAQNALCRCDTTKSLDFWCGGVVESTAGFYNKYR